MSSDASRAVSGSLTLTGGGFWEGSQRSVRVSVALRPMYRFLVDMSVERNDIALRVPRADFVATLANARVRYAFSTRMFLDALLQYNAEDRQFSANVRFSFIHRPLSDFFIVFNEQRYTDGSGVPAGRAVVAKGTPHARVLTREGGGRAGRRRSAGRAGGVGIRAEAARPRAAGHGWRLTVRARFRYYCVFVARLECRAAHTRPAHVPQ